MGIKRPLMILGSTVGAVAAVLSYHPAANSSTALLTPTPEAPVDAAANPPVASASPTATATSTPSATPTTEQSAQPTAQPSATAAKKSAKKKNSGSATSANVTTSPSDTTQSTTTTEPSATPTPTPTSKVTKDQTVTGATAQTRWGPVQVQITVKDGKIVDAVGVQYPNGDRRSLWISEQAIPWLVEETLAEQIADVQNIGGATYTTMGWRQSLASAMQKAGL